MEFSILYQIQEWHQPILDSVMVFASTIGNSGAVWILFGLILAVMPKYRKAGVWMLIAMLLSFLIGNVLLKNIVGRQRPCWLVPEIALLIENPKDYSFPSGHTLSSFTAAVTLFLYHKKAGIGALILAVMIAFSRLYLFVHFPSDVLAGFLLGTCVAYLCFCLNKKREKMVLEKK